MLVAAHHAGRLKFFGDHARLDDKQPSRRIWRRCARSIGWSTPSGRSPGPGGVAYLSRYTHRVAISNRRLLSADETGVTFRYKDYRIEGPDRYKAMTLATDEFIRRFLIHVLPKGFHRIRHYGLLANGTRAANIARARQLLAVPARPKEPKTPEAAIDEPRMLPRPCPCCGGRMIIIETFERGCEPKHRPTPAPARDQDRHIMRPSPPINDRSDERHSGRLSAGSAHARIGRAGLATNRADQSCRATRRSLVHTDARAHAWRKTDPPQPLRSSLLKPELAAKSP